VKHQRDTPHDLVPARHPVQRPKPRGRLRQLRQRQLHPVKPRQKIARRIPGKGHPGLVILLADLLGLHKVPATQHGAQNNRSSLNHPLEALIAIRKVLQGRQQGLALRAGLHHFGDLCPGQTVWFREHKVKRNGSSAQLGQFFGQFCHPATGPRPLAQLVQRRLVDRDNAHRQVGVI
jgi:hypothetical protein